MAQSLVVGIYTSRGADSLRVCVDLGATDVFLKLGQISVLTIPCGDFDAGV